MRVLICAMHLAVLPHVTAMGYYVNTACGCSDMPSRFRNDDRALVTCKNCQHTHAFKDAT